MTAAEVIEEIEKQLAWRGPSGGSMGHVVLKRELGQIILRALQDAEFARKALRNRYGHAKAEELIQAVRDGKGSP